VFGRHSADIHSRDTQPLCDGGWTGSVVSNESFENCFLRHRTLLRNLSSLSLVNASTQNLDDLPQLLNSGFIIGQAVDALVQDCRRLFRGGRGDNEDSVGG
jgi:hypothetical protein